jgi:TetR/AcrR family transcriptional repressor of nem operon
MSRPRRSEQTRQQLLDAGLTGLLTRGYHGTGLKEVLTAVGVPKGSFYNYFASKEDFAVEVIRHYARQRDEALDEALGGNDQDALGALRRYFQALARALEKDGFCGGCLVGNLGAEVEDSAACREALRIAFDDWRDRFAAALGRAQEQGTVREDLAATALADLLVDAWEGAVIRMKVQRNVEPLRQVLRQLLDGHFRP